MLCNIYTFHTLFRIADIIKYLLTSPDLKEHADIHANNDNALGNCFLNNNVELAEYLLSSPELKEHANVHVTNDKLFKYACQYGGKKLLEYLIFNYQIKKTENINTYLMNEDKNNVIKMFDKRDLQEKLQYALQNNNIINSKNKI